MSVPAYAVTVAQMLQLLDTQHADFAEGVAAGRYSFWLGSGISMKAAPGLDELARRVLEHLRLRIESDDPNDRFHKALREILKDVAGLSDDEVALLDTAAAVDEWAGIDQIALKLKNNYSRMLGVTVDGEDADYLLWSGVDPVQTYGSRLKPDVEHVCLAVLGLEGVAPIMTSANWDGLIEAALQQLTGKAESLVKVVVLADDLRRPEATVELVKFHGCAVLAGSRGTEYRRALVARQQQVTDWPNDSEHKAIRGKMLTIAAERPTLMIGLSAQDSNIQNLFSAAKTTLKWDWPSNPPAMVFAEDSVGSWQTNLLQVTYGADEYAKERPAIQDASLVRAFGKPLLTALMLDVLARKAHVLIRSCPGIQDAVADALCEGITTIRNSVAATAAGGTSAFVSQFLATTARAVAIFLRGAEPLSESTYERLTMKSASQLTETPSIDSDGVRELALALALLGRGVMLGYWSLDVSPTVSGTRGALRLYGASGDDRAVFLSASGRAAIGPAVRGSTSGDDSDALVIRCDDPAERPQRSPSAPIGRTGAVFAEDVLVRELLRDRPDVGSLDRAFRLQAGLLQ